MTAAGRRHAGFWEAARAEPDRVAVIDPAERAWTAGEMLSGANRLVHALRARGVQAGDPVATLMPQQRGAPPDAAGRLPGGLAVRADQHAPHRRRGGVHPRRLRRARRSSPTSATPRSRRRRRRPPGSRLLRASRSVRFPASSRWPTRSPNSPTARPPTGVAGGFMQYTSGTTGRPKAVQRAVVDAGSRDAGGAVRRQPHPLRHRARR